MQAVIPSSTDITTRIKIIDSTDGSPETGVTYATSGLDLWYRVGATGAKTSITEATQTITGAHADGGIVHIGSGVYRLDLPDAAAPTAEGQVVEFGGDCTGMQVLGGALVGRYAIGAAGAGLTAVGDTAGTTTLLSRLTSTRAGYLDNLSAGAVATAAKLLSYFQSALRKDVTVDSDIGGNYDDATDSQEAIRDRGDSAWGASGVATTVWEYSTRTLTQGAASVTAAVTGTSVVAYRGTRWNIPLTSLTTFSDTTYTSIIFSVKRNTDDADSEAICQVRKNRTGGGDGLTAFEGAPTVTAGQASITVNSATSITIVVEGATTQYATPDDYVYGIKVLDASGYPSMISSGGKFTVSADVPMLVS